MTILIVDDISDNRELLNLLLEGKYPLQEVCSGRQCLDRTAEGGIDLILLDVDMPEMDGYEVCEKLKANPATALIPIIFVSALTSAEARLRGYEAGGDEYLTKPVLEEDLLERIENTLREKVENITLSERATDLQTQANDAMGTALEAMTMGSELGIIIRFMQDTDSCSNYQDLATAFFSTLQQFGLNSCMMVRSRDGIKYFGCPLESLESKVLQDFRHANKIFDFGSRTIVDNAHLIFLVKNMPLDDPDKYGRMRDHLVVIANITDQRVRGLEIELELTEQREKALEGLINSCERGLTLVENKITGHEEATRRVMQTMISDLEARLFSLGLEEDQEKALMELADKAGQELELLGDFQTEIHDSLEGIINGLYKLAG